ncbi:MAG: queuosine precursor transporter [Alphaproteobacteria bacterium]|nr:queuosine precursor transporter [Alphaproteobacteria bacterium]
MGISFEFIINLMNGLTPEWVMAIDLVVCYLVMFILLRLFGAAGLQIYIAVAVIAANIQVLKIVQFSIYPDPVALGTVLFSTTYVATDILTEYYGRPVARRAVLLGFAGMIMMTMMMTIALGYHPLPPDQDGGNHNHILSLFLPIPAILVASMCAYLVSQFNDIWVFQTIRRLTKGRMLWLRAAGSTAVSALIDNIVFSTLAWYILAPEPVEMHTLIFTYILGTYFIRLALALTETPVMYLARRCLPFQDRKNTSALSL